ncbi:MAG: carboxymuconolactone decarboxylase family protein [Ramlibacter sp.]|nr:carboxymuconolactone decarboxylase family protein [Ramlibacter sp.]
MEQARLPHTTLAPEAFKAMLGVSAALHKSSLGPALQALLHVRVSQINHCGYCLDMHARELLNSGEDLQRLNSLPAWREVGFYTERERAALQWAESVTSLHEGQAPQAHFDALRPHFSDQEIAELTFSIAQINAWNRLGVAMRLPVSRKPLKVRAESAT